MNTQGHAKLGLGCVTFGREIDQKTSFSLLDHAYAQGINDFDTAAVYGAGASEEVLGAWLKNNPEKRIQLKIATKIVPPYSYGQLIKAVDQSLKRLHVETIDLLYFHRWDPQLAYPESWLAIEDLIFQGKIGKIGVSNFNAQQLIDAVNLLKITSPIRITGIQNNHNLAVSELSSEIIHYCAQEAIDIITFSPLGAGFLTGKHINGIAKGSRFDVMPAHRDVYFNEFASKRLARLLEIAAKHQHSPALLALAWAIHQPSTTQVLIGGRNTAQLDLAIAASKFDDRYILNSLTSN
jgi:aryl-alcohol dehydrogenase-like predicted oxidoreductase